MKEGGVTCSAYCCSATHLYPADHTTWAINTAPLGHLHGRHIGQYLPPLVDLYLPIVYERSAVRLVNRALFPTSRAYIYHVAQTRSSYTRRRSSRLWSQGHIVFVSLSVRCALVRMRLNPKPCLKELKPQPRSARGVCLHKGMVGLANECSVSA